GRQGVRHSDTDPGTGGGVQEVPGLRAACERPGSGGGRGRVVGGGGGSARPPTQPSPIRLYGPPGHQPISPMSPRDQPRGRARERAMSNLIHTSASEFVKAAVLIAEATGKQPRHYSESVWIGN